jgi:hypothetical protein
VSDQCHRRILERVGVVSGKFPPFADPRQWEDWDADDAPHLWHQIHSQPYTNVLDDIPLSWGAFACIVCSKLLGIGSAERSWGGVKHLKTNKRSHIPSQFKCSGEAGNSVWSLLCREGKALPNQQAQNEGGDWEEEDFQSLGFDKYLLDLIVISGDKKIAGKFFAFTEAWELEVLNDNKSAHSETLLLLMQPHTSMVV